MDTFDPELVHAIFKLVWIKRAAEREKCDDGEALEVVDLTSKKRRPISVKTDALKLSCELLRMFVTETVERAGMIAEAEGVSKIEATHLERILPQLLLDF